MKPTSLIVDPTRLRLQYLIPSEEQLTLVVQTIQEIARCPRCQHSATRVHSRYCRQIADLPWNGLPVTWRLEARRFFCEQPGCSQGIFAERLDGVLASFAHRTQRLEEALVLVALALGGEAGSRLAREWGVKVSPDTLLRLVKARQLPTGQRVRVLGVDDFAFRKGQRYGTILIDLERHRVLDLLPDRQAQTLATWLKEHPEVEILCRDRSSTYAEGSRQGAPQAKQVADRWHLLHNLVEALANLLARQLGALQAAVQAETALVPPEAAPVPASEGTGEPAGAAPQHPPAAPRRGRPPKEKRCGGRRSQVPPFHDYLAQRWQAGVRNRRQLWRELLDQGFAGSERAVARYLAPWREGGPTAPRPPGAPRPRAPTGKRRTPSPRQVSWWLLQEATELEAAQQQYVARLLAHAPLIGQAQALAQEFFGIVRQQQTDPLEAWLAAVRQSGIGEFQALAVGLANDQEAVQAALELPWSNGQTEGQVHRLKAIKRQMYGRAGFELLRARVLPAA